MSIRKIRKNLLFGRERSENLRSQNNKFFEFEILSYACLW